MSFNISSYTKECCFGIILVKNIQYPRSDIRCGTVIKSQENTFFFIWKIPYKTGEYSPYYFEWLYSHFTMFALAKIIIKIYLCVIYFRYET